MAGVAVIRVFLVLLAVLLGFTFLSLLQFHSDLPSDRLWLDGGRHPNLRVLLAPQTISMTRRRPGTMKWRRYGVVEGTETVPAALLEEAGEHQPSLDSIPALFQEQIMSGLPLYCHPGEEGLFKRRYSRFLHILQAYVDQHHAMKQLPSSRTLTWHCPPQGYCGGLGDRIRGVTYALLLAIFSRRQLIIFWEGPAEGAFLTPHMIDWRDEATYEFLRNEAAGKKELPRNYEAPEMFSFKAVLQHGEVVNDVSSSSMGYYQRIIGSNKTNIIVATNLEPSSLLDSERSGDQDWIRSGLHWSGLSHLTPKDVDDLVGLAFRYLFKLKDDVLDEMVSAQEVLGLTDPYTALHLRTGFASMNRHEELMRHPKLQQNVSQWRSNIKCAVKAADALLGNSSVLYLATDSNMVKEMALVKYPHRFRTLKNSLVHVDLLGKGMGELGPGEEEEGVMAVWVELLLLAQAKVLVRGESGFSQTAGLLCGMHGNRTIDSKQCW